MQESCDFQKRVWEKHPLGVAHWLAPSTHGMSPDTRRGRVEMISDLANHPNHNSCKRYRHESRRTVQEEKLSFEPLVDMGLRGRLKKNNRNLFGVKGYTKYRGAVLFHCSYLRSFTGFDRAAATTGKCPHCSQRPCRVICWSQSSLLASERPDF